MSRAQEWNGREFTARSMIAAPCGHLLLSWMIAPVKAVAGLIFDHRLGGILIACPVAGFRPVRENFGFENLESQEID